MRIAVVTTSYPSSEDDPAGHFVRAEVRELARRGHEVEVFCPRAGGAFGWPGAPTRLRTQPLHALEAAAWVAKTHRALARFRPERVLSHWCVPSAFPIAIAFQDLGAELEVVSHGGDVRLLRGLPTPVRARIVSTVLARAHVWRFVSEELRASLEAVLDPALATALRRVSVVAPSPVEVPDVHADAQRKRSEVAGRRLYVCAGRLVASKRVDKVIDYVATSPGVQARVLVVLGDGPQRGHLERQARAWQMDARFLGTTSRREALGWIGAADELVHASHVEGLSTVVREAEHLGTAVTILS